MRFPQCLAFVLAGLLLVACPAPDKEEPKATKTVSSKQPAKSKGKKRSSTKKLNSTEKFKNKKEPSKDAEKPIKATPYDIAYKKHMDGAFKLNLAFQKSVRLYNKDSNDSHRTEACSNGRALVENYDTWHKANPMPDEVKNRPPKARYDDADIRHYLRSVEEEKETRTIAEAFLKDHCKG